LIEIRYLGAVSAPETEVCAGTDMQAKRRRAVIMQGFSALGKLSIREEPCLLCYIFTYELKVKNTTEPKIRGITTLS